MEVARSDDNPFVKVRVSKLAVFAAVHRLAIAVKNLHLRVGQACEVKSSLSAGQSDT